MGGGLPAFLSEFPVAILENPLARSGALEVPCDFWSLVWVWDWVWHGKEHLKPVEVPCALAQPAQSWEVNLRAPERVVREQVTDLVIFI